MDEEKKDAKPGETLPEKSSFSADSSGDLVSTVEAVTVIPSSEETQKTETPEEKEAREKAEAEAKEKAEAKAKEKAEQEAAEKAKREKEELERFDKHPRFQELNKRMKAAELRAEKAETEIETLRKGKETKEELDFIDVTTKTDEELLEWQQSDPKGYAANLARQIRYEVKQETPDLEEVLKTQKLDELVEKTYNEYAAINPDFDEMWDSGELQRYMAKHPGHNAISAHMAIIKEKQVAKGDGDIQRRIDEAVAKTVKETEERMVKQFKAKRHADVLPGGPTSTGGPSGTPPDLKDTKKYGGLTSVLAQRSRERERQGGE